MTRRFPSVRALATAPQLRDVSTAIQCFEWSFCDSRVERVERVESGLSSVGFAGARQRT